MSASTLGDVVEITTGFAFPSREFTADPTDTRLLRGDNVSQGRLRWDKAQRWPASRTDDFDALLLADGDVVLAMDRPWVTAGLKYARVRQEDLPCLLVQRVARLRARSGLDQDFLRWLVASEWFTQHILSVQTGTTVPHISATQICSFRIPWLAPVETQREIAGILCALDDKVESNRRLLSILSALLEAEYAVAVVDAEREPFYRTLIVEMGSPFVGSLFNESALGRPLIRIRDLASCAPQLWTTENRDDEKEVVPGDVLVGMDAEFRSRFWLGSPGVLNQRVCRVVPRDGVSRVFALLAIRPDLEFFEGAKSGTTVIHLNKADIDTFEVPSLTPAAHMRLREATEPLVDRLVNTAAESQRLEALRDTLLPELLSERLLEDGVLDKAPSA